MHKHWMIANWKMNKTAQETVAYFERFLPLVLGTTTRVGIAVPFPSLPVARPFVENTAVLLGAQNCSEQSQGAFTGEVSAAMVEDVGARFVIVGHSERRRLFQETDEQIRAKVAQALAVGLEVVLCVGEDKVERAAGRAEQVVAEQLRKGLAGIESLDRVTISYEPLWAVGTGQAASPDEVEQIHRFCQTVVATPRPPLYGGSVTLTNARQFLSRPSVGGLLVGGASLDPTIFARMVRES